MYMKKRASVKRNKVTAKGSALSGAIRDLEIEIKRLSKEKSGLKRNLTSVSSAINVDRQMEKELQQKVARLIEREANLNQRRKNLQVKIDRAADKMSKITKIRSEMADI